MFVHYQCECGEAYRIPKTDPDLELLTLRLPCPSETCSQKIQIVEAFGGAQLVIAKTLYEACMGRGFPDERRCSPTALRKLLLNGVIADMTLCEATSDGERSIITTMRVDCINGPDMLVHFATSVHGSTIYKVTEVK